MSAYVFTGPTISPAEGCAELEAVYLPPAAEGDVYRASLKRPPAIGIMAMDISNQHHRCVTKKFCGP